MQNDNFSRLRAAFFVLFFGAKNAEVMVMLTGQHTVQNGNLGLGELPQTGNNADFDEKSSRSACG
jgi:hypothetical protein